MLGHLVSNHPTLVLKGRTPNWLKRLIAFLRRS